MSAHSSPQGTTRSISTRNCARRVIFAYFSNPEPASVICLLFILVPRSCLLSAEALHFRQVNRGLVQRFPSLRNRHRARKDQARIHRRNRPFLHHHQEQAHYARQNRDEEIRSRGAQARDLQGSQDQIRVRVNPDGLAPPVCLHALEPTPDAVQRAVKIEKARDRGLFVWLRARDQQLRRRHRPTSQPDTLTSAPAWLPRSSRAELPQRRACRRSCWCRRRRFPRPCRLRPYPCPRPPA